MKNQLTLITTGILALAVLFACTTQESPKTDPATLKSEIQEMENRWAEAFNAGDVDGLLAMYADDATGMSNERPLVSGKENIRQALIEETAARNTDNKFTFTTLNVTGDEHMLVETGMTTITYPDGKAEQSGKYMAVWKKQGDRWVCTHDMSNTNQPNGPAGYKSVHLLDLPNGVEEAELADALARLNAAIEGQGYPGAGYFLYKTEGEADESYRYYFEGVWPSKAAYDAVHTSAAWKKEAEAMSVLAEKIRDKEIYRKVMLVK